jgi:hypothetical protein
MFPNSKTTQAQEATSQFAMRKFKAAQEAADCSRKLSWTALVFGLISLAVIIFVRSQR